MTLNSIPLSTALIPAALPKNPLSVKSRKEESAEFKLERNEFHKKIKLKAMAQVIVWKPAAQSAEQENPSSGTSVRSTMAGEASAVIEVKSSRESNLPEMQLPVFQPTPHVSVHLLQPGADRERQKAAAQQKLLVPVVPTRATTDRALSERYQAFPFLIGQGTYGTIMQGYDLVSRSPVAIKKPTSIPSAYRSVVRESKVLQELEKRHAPHCLHLRAAFDQSSSGIKEHVMVTDWIPERNMYENHLNPQTRVCNLNYLHIFSFGKQLLEYLAALNPDFIHGDLAPSNLIYEMNCCHLTVLDHGLSRKVNDKTTQLIQKSFYRSPEAILKGPIDCSTDIWSVGCILFELFTKTALFRVFDDPTDLVISSDELLLKMSHQIGLPEKQFLKKCANTSKYYLMRGSKVQFHRPVPVEDVPWRMAVLSHASLCGMPVDQAHGFIQLLEGMLRYENRLSASELLRSPLFQMGISFHLSPTFLSGDMITIYHAWDMHRHMENPMTIPFPLPVFQLNNTHVTRTCFHIPLRDPEDQYIVYLVRQGVSYPGQCWILKEGQALDFVFSPIAEEASAAEVL